MLQKGFGLPDDEQAVEPGGDDVVVVAGEGGAGDAVGVAVGEAGELSSCCIIIYTDILALRLHKSH
jgi:shikimate 5-dehydrogenase